MRRGTASEASLIAKILPMMLLDFLPLQEVMNKIFSEFLSSQQPHPELIAKVAYEVFLFHVDVSKLETNISA